MVYIASALASEHPDRHRKVVKDRLTELLADSNVALVRPIIGRKETCLLLSMFAKKIQGLMDKVRAANANVQTTNTQVQNTVRQRVGVKTTVKNKGTAVRILIGARHRY